MISPLNQSTFYQLFDAAAIATSVTFFFNPVVGASCALTHLALERLANGPDYDRPFLPLNQKTITDFTKVWKEYAFNLFKGQTLLGVAFKILGITIPQAAILYLRASLGSISTALVALGRIVILAPLIEETLFRGFFQRALRNVQILTFGSKDIDKTKRKAYRCAFQAIAFGLAHYHKAQKIANLPIVVMTGLIGFFLGVGQEAEKGSLAGPISYHSLLNASASFRICVFGT